MKQHMLIAILIIKGGLEVVRKDISGQITEMVEFERKVTYP